MNRKERLYRMKSDEFTFGATSPRSSYDQERRHEPMSQSDGYAGDEYEGKPLEDLVKREKELFDATNNGSFR